MPNKRRNTKLRNKLLVSGANLKNEHVKTTLKELIKKSKIQNGDDDDDDQVVEKANNEQELVSENNETVVETKTNGNNNKNANTSANITKKNKKNKYFLLAHPEFKEKVKNEGNFVVNKEVVEKKFLVETVETNGNNNSQAAVQKAPKNGSLWVIEPCTSSDEDEPKGRNKKNDKKKDKAKKRKIDEVFSIPEVKFETKKETLEDGTVIEVYNAINEIESEEEQEEAEKDEIDEDNEVHEESEENKTEETKKSKKKKQKTKAEEAQENTEDDDSNLTEAEKRLKSSRFRYLNELLYTKKSDDSFDYFKSDNDAFKAYHQGFQSQAAKWPTNPLEVIIKSIKSKSSSLIVADFGCGEAKLAQELINNKVHSFDFVALNDLVTACDMKKVPLNSKSCDIAVFCLSLMGTNVVDFICEAHRVLKLNGLLKIAEVASRFDNIQMFIKNVESVGFKCISKEIKPGSYFYFFDFTKTSNETRSKPLIKLSPCLYKKR